jgi:hypothetical protein
MSELFPSHLRPRWAYLAFQTTLAIYWVCHMGHWSFFDWIAYGALAIGAMILAAETGLSQSPSLLQGLPQFFKHPFWGLAPLILVLIATGILGARAAGIIGPESNSVPIANTPAPDPSKVFLQGWGILSPATYQVTIDSSQIIQYKDAYRVFLVVRTSFSDIDRMTDEYLETSNPYTIQNSIMLLTHASSSRLRFLIDGPTMVEYNVAILPKNVSEKEVTTLNSIEHLGGKIIASASQTVLRNKPTTKAPFCSLINC